MSKVGAKQTGQYSWIAKQGETNIVIAELDPIDAERNVYNHMDGTFQKSVPPMANDDGTAPQTIKHAQELLDVLNQSLKEEAVLKVMLVRGTKNGTSKTGVKAALDGDVWRVKEVSGDLPSGYQFSLYRAES